MKNGELGFCDQYDFLSNFYHSPITLDHITYPSVENAYQAQKCKNPKDRLRFVGITAGQAKRSGRQVDIVDGWDEKKLGIMEQLLRLKFRDGVLLCRLLDTEDEELTEFCTWPERFFGVYKGKGENNLGKLLMKIRGEYNDDV